MPKVCFSVLFFVPKEAIFGRFTRVFQNSTENGRFWYYFKNNTESLINIKISNLPKNQQSIKTKNLILIKPTKKIFNKFKMFFRFLEFSSITGK